MTDPNTLLMSSALFWMLSVLKPTDKEFKRADKVLGPATKNLFVPTQAIEEFWIANHFGIEAFGWQKENSEIRCRWWKEVFLLDILSKNA